MNPMKKNRQLLYCYGRVPDQLKEPIELNIHTEYPIKKIACGNNHCIILFEDNRIGVFGSNENGQLGLDINIDTPIINNLFIPQLKINDSNNYRIWDIAAGNDYSLLLIGVGHITSLVKFGSKYEEDTILNDPMSLSTIVFNSFITDDLANINKKITNISSIYAFEERIILSTGGNQVYIGGVGFDNYNQLHHFKLIGSFDNPIKTVALGRYHCLILDGIMNNKLIDHIYHFLLRRREFIRHRRRINK